MASTTQVASTDASTASNGTKPIETNVDKPEGDGPLQQLCANLTKLFAKDPSGPSDTVKSLMSEYINKHIDWKEFCIYHPAFYARNLVHRNQHYELIVICWQDGQKSPIHNHAGSSCWMGCLEGTIEETYYHIVEPEEGEAQRACANGICPNLRKGTSSELHKGSVGYIRDEIALHVIRPVEGNGVSLHLYSPPINNCSIYIPALGKVAQKQLGYFTINKQRCQED